MANERIVRHRVALKFKFPHQLESDACVSCHEKNNEEASNDYLGFTDHNETI